MTLAQLLTAHAHRLEHQLSGHERRGARAATAETYRRLRSVRTALDQITRRGGDR